MRGAMSVEHFIVHIAVLAAAVFWAFVIAVYAWAMGIPLVDA